MKALIATQKPFVKEANENIREILEKEGIEACFLKKYIDKKELIEAVSDADALIVRSDLCDKYVLDAAPVLKIVVRAGAGYDNIDIKAASERGIVVMNTPGQNSNAVAELTFGLLIYSLRSGFTGKAGFELKGKSIGIMGFGEVGKNIARIAEGFKMKVNAFSRSLTMVKAEYFKVKQAESVEKLFNSSEIISLNLPLTEQTSGLIGYELLSTMPKGATLVNTCRKEVIREDDLLKVMEEREDFRFLSDIAPSNREQLEDLFPSRVFITGKKMGAQTYEANYNAGSAAAKQIVLFLTEGNTTYQVNKI
jgi:D-3-phosphoglycerate dehydrogenase